jgi:large repetitive protein
MNSVLRVPLVFALGALFVVPSAKTQETPEASSHWIASAINLSVTGPSGAAVPRAKVTITDEAGTEIANGLTDKRGEFSVSQVPPGPYAVTIQSIGFKTQTKAVLVKEATVTEVGLSLSPEAVKSSPDAVQPPQDPVHHGELAIDLVVKDENSAVIRRASVTIIQKETGAKIVGQTNQIGEYHLPGLAVGSYALTVECRGFRAHKTTVTLQPHESYRIGVVLQIEAMKEYVFPGAN